MLEEMHAVVHGKVHGVGFRATCRIHAVRLGLTGHVCNLPDGTVEIYAQGPKKELEKLLSFLREEFGSNIQDISTDFYPVKDKQENFSIR